MNATKNRWILLGIIAFICYSQALSAQNITNWHPRNKKLKELGLLKGKPYFPEIPRCTPQEALAMYQSGKALIVWVGTYGGLVPGGIHLTELQAEKLDPRRLPLNKGQALLIY